MPSCGYEFYRVHEFAAELKDFLLEKKYNFSEETNLAIHALANDAEELAKVMREVEWLCSGSINEETFLSNIKRIKDEKNSI